MSDKVYAYLAEAQLSDGSSVLLDLEEHGWADPELLARTVRWTLFPKDDHQTVKGTKYPFVVVNIPSDGKPVFRSKRYGTLSDAGGIGVDFRCYAVGYKQGGKTFLVWVTPTGDIEVADDDPWLANLYMNSQIGVPA